MEPVQLEVTASNRELSVYIAETGELIGKLGVNKDGELVVHAPDCWWAESSVEFNNATNGLIDVEFSTTVSDRDKVLHLIRKSFKEKPKQTKTEVSEISRDIARKVYGSATRKNVMRVAGYRAAQSRGVYDQ